MLRFDSRNKNFNAACLVNDVVVASFNASLNEPEGHIYINVNADNTTRFTSNLASIKVDLESFIDEVLGITE